MPLKRKTSDAQRYRDLFFRSLAGGYQSTLGGELLDCNDAFAKIFGYESRDDCLQRWDLDIHVPEERRNAFRAALKESRAVRDEESLLFRKDATPVWVLENTLLLKEEQPDAESSDAEAYKQSFLLD